MADFDIKKPELFPNATKFLSDGAARHPLERPMDRPPETSKLEGPPVPPTLIQNPQAGVAPAAENAPPAAENAAPQAGGVAPSTESVAPQTRRDGLPAYMGDGSPSPYESVGSIGNGRVKGRATGWLADMERMYGGTF